MTTERYPTNLSDSTLDFLRDHIQETPEKRIEYLTKLRNHFDTIESTTIRITNDEHILLAFLRGCKYNLPRTIDKLRSYYQLRADQPKIFAERDPCAERIQNILHLGMCVPLRRLQNGCLVALIRVATYDPYVYSIEEILKVAYMILDVSSKICPQLQIYGICVVFDMEGMSLGHIRILTPSILKHTVRAWENYHCKPKQLLFINVPSLFNIILNVLRSMMSKKLQERLHAFRGGYETLTGLVDNAVLPTECGGEDGSIEEHSQFWLKTVTDHADWLLLDEQFKII